jgi:hypothetical protein
MNKAYGKITNKMRVQHGSDGFHHGNPPDHEAGIDNVIAILKCYGYTHFVRPFRVWFSPLFIKTEMLQYPFWEYDLAAWHRTRVHVNDEPDYIIEIDGEKHSKKAAKIKDGIAAKYINQYFHHTFFCRIDKHDTIYEVYVLKKLRIPVKFNSQRESD